MNATFFNDDFVLFFYNKGMKFYNKGAIFTRFLFYKRRAIFRVRGRCFYKTMFFTKHFFTRRFFICQLLQQKDDI